MTSDPQHTGGAPPRPLKPLALAREAIDRATEQRTDPDWLARARAGPGTQVLVVDDGKTLVRFGDRGASLALLPPAQAPDGPEFFLGLDHDGRAYFGVMAPLPGPAGLPLDGPGQVRVAGLREAGALLGDRDAGLFTHAVALANWHARHTHCPRCGAPTTAAPDGHSTVCTADGSEHFPRTDPAMITLVTDADDRALLARNSAWPERRVSILAGFVEPGESVEQAIVREVAEETAIVVDDIRYLASQPWPMPQSLMLGFWARAAPGQQIRVDGQEIVEARWFSRDDLREAMAAGQIRLPPPVSIAHRIIEAWYGEELPTLW